MTVTADDVARAATAIQGHVVRTPLVESRRLGEPLGVRLFFKLENLQFTGAFKDRGACHKLQLLRHGDSPPRGVVAASAGNHAQGVAHHARRLGIPATIVMPQATPFSKIERTEHLGAVVVLHGESLSEAAAHAQQLVAEHGFTFIHPYDDEAIVAGQGTCGIEILEDAPDLDVLLVPIGGGGLMAGIATWVRSRRSDLRLIGVQTELCPSMRARLRGEPAPSLRTNTLADGIAVKQPGEITSAILQRTIDDILLVDETALEQAVQVLCAQQKVVVEGAGAVGFAALQQHHREFAGKKVGVVLSGGNIDRRMLSTVLLRGLRRDGKVTRVRIEIQDQPGVLSKVTQLIGRTGADIIDIEHHRLFSTLPPRQAELQVVMETRGGSHVETILQTLQAAGFPARVL